MNNSIYKPETKLSKHFNISEMIKSSTASRMEIDNTPSIRVLKNAELVAEKILEPIRIHFGIPFSPNSWYRGEELERVLCYPSYKRWCRKKVLDPNAPSNWKTYFERKSHPKGEAVDIEIPGIYNDSLYIYIRDNLEFDQLIREFAKEGDPMSGWVHVSYRKDNNRNEAFSIG